MDVVYDTTISDYELLQVSPLFSEKKEWFGIDMAPGKLLRSDGKHVYDYYRHIMTVVIILLCEYVY